MRVKNAEPKRVDQRPAQQAGTGVNAEVGAESPDCGDGAGAFQRPGFQNRNVARRRIALVHTQFARAGTIRLKLLKIGALLRISVRRIKLAMPSAFAYQAKYRAAHAPLIASSH